MSVQTDLDARVASLKGILDESNAALTDKGGEAAQTLSGLPAAIENLPTAELSDVFIMPTGKDFEVEPEEGTGFGTISVAGDMNLEPQNIAAGVTIYGVEGTLVPGATSSIPEEYQPYVDHALLLYTGEYENMAILEWNEHLAIVFMMSDFAVTEYNEAATEFKAQGWVSCSFNKLTDNWTFTDWRNEPSTGGNYVMNIRYSSVYWYYNGQIIWPFGMSGGGGGGAGLNIAYGDTAPEDTTKLWVKAAEPNAVEVTTGKSFSAGGIEQVTTLSRESYGIATAAVGSKVYLFGGYNQTTQISVFDRETETVTTLSTTLPTGGYSIAPAVVGNKVYLFGGAVAYNSNSKAIMVFDTETETVTQLNTTIPKALTNITAAAVGSKVYLFGGKPASGSAVNTIYVFNTENETIASTGTTLPAGRQSMGVGVLGTKVYLLGGMYSDVYNTVLVFDTETYALTTSGATLPAALSNMGFAQVGAEVYLFGGYNNGYLNTIHVFDMATETGTTLESKLPKETQNISAAFSGGTVYLVGGQNINPAPVLKMTVFAPLAPGKMILQYAIGGKLFPVINSDALTIEMCPASVHIGDESGAAQPTEAFIYTDGAWTAI